MLVRFCDYCTSEVDGDRFYVVKVERVEDTSTETKTGPAQVAKEICPVCYLEFQKMVTDLIAQRVKETSGAKS